MEFASGCISQDSSMQSSNGSDHMMTSSDGFKQDLRHVAFSFFSSKGRALLQMLHAIIKGIDGVNHDIKRIDARIAVVAKQLEDRKEKKAEKSKKERLKVKPMQYFIAPYFRDSRKRHPPLNFISKEKISRKDFDAYWTLAIPWGTAERRIFLKIVHEAAKDSILKPICLRKAFLENKLAEDIVDEEERENVRQKVEQLHQEMCLIKHIPFEEILKHSECKLDWLFISGKMENLAFNRTPDECEKMWNNLLDPEINRKKFTREEDAKLIQLALTYNEKQWKVIAQELGTNRTAIQCVTRYQSHLNKNLTKKYWTEDEDCKLIEIIEKFKIGDYIPWTRVIAFMPGRSLLQLQNRWDRCLKPQKRDSDWSVEEDAILLLSVAVIKQPLWGKISSLLYGRTSYYCRERYTNTLDPELLTGAWSVKDDKKLLLCLAEHGEKWGKISRAFPERTDNMVNNRCKIIKRYKPRLYEEILKKGLNYDFNKFPKKQLAPSKVCTDINNVRDNLRSSAFVLAKAAAEKVLGDKIDFSSCRIFKDFGSLLNEASLELVAAELLPEHDGELKRPFLKYHIRLEYDSAEETELEDSSEDEFSFESDSDDDYDANDDVDIKEDEDDEKYGSALVKSDNFRLPKSFNLETFMIEFDRRLFPNAEIGARNYTPGINLKSKKKDIEYTVLLQHVFKMYNLSLPADYYIEESDTTYYNVNYSKVVPQVMDMFVMAHTDEPSLPIMPPNLTTLKGAKMLYMVNGHLKEWMERLDKPGCNLYNSFASKASNGKILCTYCTEKLEQEIHSKRMNIKIEEDCEDDEALCTCNVVRELRQKWLTFLYRFSVFFIWPMLLCSEGPSRKQILNLVLRPIRMNNQAIQLSAKKKRKRNVCSEPEDYETE